MAVRFTPSGLQSYDPLAAFRKKKKKKTTGKTTHPKPPSSTSTIVPEETRVPEPRVFKDAETGRVTGVELPTGEVYRGNEQDVERLIDLHKEGGAVTPEGKAKTPTRGQMQQLERAGVFEEEPIPERVSLAPVERDKLFEGIGEIPVAGAQANAMAVALMNLAQPSAFKGEQAFPIPITPEVAREAALRKIRQKSYKKGISVGETAGAFIEALLGPVPWLGTAVRELSQTPSKNADEIVRRIELHKSGATELIEKLRNGLEDPYMALDKVRYMEEDIADAEGRIKLLIETSANLRVNNDEILRIQEQFFKAKEKVAQVRRAAAIQITADITGTRKLPDDAQLYFELMELNKR